MHIPTTHPVAVNARLFSWRAGGAQRGAALVLALGMLAVVSLLGAQFLRFAWLELDQAHLQVRGERAEAAALAGVQAGIGSLDRALREGDPLSALGPHSLSLPVYRGLEDAGGAAVLATRVEEAEATAELLITDESGKVNLNHAPASVLQAVLQVDGATARAITASLPRDDGSAEEPGRRWLLNLDELLTRGLLTPEQFARVDRKLVTVYTVLDHGQPGAWLSINTAPPEVVAAVLDLPLEEAERVKAAGPFDSLSALAEAAGKTPDTFNLRAHPDGSSPIRFTPHCFQIISRGHYGGQAVQRPASAALEAVVFFHAPGDFEMLRWTAPEQAEEEAQELLEAPGEEEPLETEHLEATACLTQPEAAWTDT